METMPKPMQVLQIHPDVTKFAAALMIAHKVNEDRHEVSGWVISLRKKKLISLETDYDLITVSIDDVEPIGFAYWSPNIVEDIDESTPTTRQLHS